MPDARPTQPADRDLAMPAWSWPPPARGPRLIHVSAAGVLADLLHGLVRAQAAAGTPVGWAVLAGGGQFAATATYLHRLLHDRADPAALTTAGIATRYRSALAPQAPWLAGQLAPGDVVVLHDTATLGLAPRLAGTGARVVWHCHAVAASRTDAGPAALWREFGPELSTLDALVTAAVALGPQAAPAIRRYLCAPAVDLASPRNQELSRAAVDDLLAEVGLTGGQPGNWPGDRGVAQVAQHGPVPADARVVLHAASWDSLADLPGLLGCLPSLPADVHLVLAGPDLTDAPHRAAGPDDPGAPDPAASSADRATVAAAGQLRAALAGLSIVDRLRVHLVSAGPGCRPAEAALLLNAMHRRADVVLQASLADGHGLAVPEAMAKRRAVLVADADELPDLVAGRSGPRPELARRRAVVAALRILLDDPRLCRELGERAGATMAGHCSMARLVADYRTFAAVRAPVEQGLQATR
jgi:trehalose synthase